MYIIAGLGNPGKDFEHTRHNMGFLAIDCFAAKHNININKRKFKGLYGEGIVGEEKIVLIKPQTYMNLSGESILDIIQFYKAEVQNLIVVYDDASIPLGRIRIRPSGSDGGHNGMKSIIYLLESNEFTRLRIGIGNPDLNMIDHVLGRLSADERKIMDDVVGVACEAVNAIIKNGVQFAMNKYNSYKHESLAAE
jgi:PTH1 family peptidyl-tRNA hydrolase